MRCTACDSPMNYKKKRPATVFSGQMMSEFTDNVPEFPKHEQEDLCEKCIRSIRDYSSDLNQDTDVDNHFTYVDNDREVVNNLETDDTDMFHNARMTEAVYEGFRDTY